MRRTRFAGAVEIPGEAKCRAPVREALWFDILAPDTPDDHSLSAIRVASLDYSALMLAVTHLIAVIALSALHPDRALAASFGNPLVPLGALLGLDLVAIAALHWRDRFNLAPHTVIRGLAAYLAAAGSLWILVGLAMSGQSHAGHAAFPMLLIGGGITMAAMVAVNSPSLALANSLVTTAGAFILTRSPLVGGGAALLSMVMVAYSVAGARTILAAGRKRLNLDAEARKALTFVAEFENSGRGWFWETNSEGTLSYVSQQLADDFQCEPQELLGRPFADLLSVDTSPVGTIHEERRTLGFHLSARFPFSDVVVRPASDQDVHWSLSGNPIFDERGRFLGFRGIGTDLTEQRRSEQAHPDGHGVGAHLPDRPRHHEVPLIDRKRRGIRGNVHQIAPASHRHEKQRRDCGNPVPARHRLASKAVGHLVPHILQGNTAP